MTSSLAELPAVNGHPTVADATQPIRLDIGGGNTPLEGYINVDRKNGLEAYPLDFADNSVEEVHASHVLEHFPYADGVKVLKEWMRVLKPGGRLRVAVPDMYLVAKCIVEGAEGDPVRWVYGGQIDGNDYHKNGYDEGGLRRAMALAGLTGVGRWKSDRGDAASLPISLNLEGFKPTPVLLDPAKRKRIHAVMTMPRLAFADNMYCAIRALTTYGVEYTRLTGVFWHEMMERVISGDMDSYDWIVTLDYDTVFDCKTFERMAMLFETHPEIDALAPLQARRGANEIIAKIDKKITHEYMWNDVATMDTAHFGLTFLRVSALRKMSHPWFIPVPNKDGKWEDGRLDADIHFWHKWKECGNTLAVTPRVSVGHLELMVAWPDENFNVAYQHTDDYDKHGAPSIVRGALR